MTKSNDELKACPFCGSENIELYWADNEQAAAHCNGCRASGPDNGHEESTDFEDAAKLWNTRTGDKS